MSELKERLERLADVGTPLGAPAVWQRVRDQLAPASQPLVEPVGPDPRRRVGVVVALILTVVLVAAGLGYVVAGRGQGSAVRVARGAPTDSLVLFSASGDNPFTVVDLATGASRAVALPGKVGGDFTYDVIGTGGYFVYQSARGVLAVPTTLNGAPHLVGRASAYLPSSRPGRVWLTTVPGGGGLVQGQEVSVDSRTQSPRYRLPIAEAPTAAVNDGLVFGDYVWYPATNTTRALPTSVSGTFDAHGSLLAGGLNCAPILPGCSSLEVFNLANNKHHIYPAPPGTSGWIPTAGEGVHAAFAPDGQHLALRVALTAAPLSSQVYVLNLATGTTALVPHSQARAYSPVAWTPDGRSVLFETDTSTLGTYQPANATSRTLPDPCCGTLVSVPR
jgi:hypothetical protein